MQKCHTPQIGNSVSFISEVPVCLYPTFLYIRILASSNLVLLAYIRRFQWISGVSPGRQVGVHMGLYTRQSRQWRALPFLVYLSTAQVVATLPMPNQYNPRSVCSSHFPPRAVVREMLAVPRDFFSGIQVDLRIVGRCPFA